MTISLAGWATAVSWGLAAAWCLFSAIAFVAQRGVRALPDLAHIDRGSNPLPRVSVIVAARDEERRIRDTVERLLRQVGVDLELIIVNDRSTDATPAILDALAREHPRLRVLHVEHLPEGWLGKPHACHLAAREASGDWLLFTDADAWLNADVLARALYAARVDDAAHVCLLPGEERSSLAVRAALTLTMAATAPVPALANRDIAFAGVGVGAFNLVRADAYRKVGGYERLRMEVLDDLKLGRILQHAGLRTRVHDASRDLKVQWAGDLRGLLRAVEKNMFAVYRFDTALATFGMVVPMVVWSTTLILPWTGAAPDPAAFAPLAGLMTVWIPALGVARRSGSGAWAALLSPLAVPILVAMILRSMVKTLRQGGVRWRDTFYPLADLRRGRV